VTKCDKGRGSKLAKNSATYFTDGPLHVYITCMHNAYINTIHIIHNMHYTCPLTYLYTCMQTIVHILGIMYAIQYVVHIQSTLYPHRVLHAWVWAMHFVPQSTLCSLPPERITNDPIQVALKSIFQKINIAFFIIIISSSSSIIIIIIIIIIISSWRQPLGGDGYE